MIIDFSVANFGGLKDTIKLSFEPEKSDHLKEYYLVEPVKGLQLLKMGLIYGPNGSGKTTILKALDFLRDMVLHPSEQKQEVLHFRPFLFDPQTVLAPTHFELNIVYRKVRYRYILDLTQTAVVSEALYFYAPNKALVYQRNTDTEKQLATIKFGGKTKLKRSAEEMLEANTLWNATVLSAFLKTNIEAKELKDVTDWFVNVLREMITPKLNLNNYVSEHILSQHINKQHMLQFLQKADFAITDILIEKTTRPVTEDVRTLLALLANRYSDINAGVGETVEQLELSFLHTVKTEAGSTAYLLPFKEESEGTKRYFQLSGLLDLMLNNEGVFAIDELESSLHPDLLKHFLLLFLVNVKKTQLIATTHYRELLLEKEMLRNDAIWFTEKKENGNVELYSLGDFDSSIVRDTTSVFNAYKSGKLGAVPDVKDYYLDSSNGKK